MKQKIKNSCIAVLSASLLSASMLNAQDTMRVVKETTVVHDANTLFMHEFGVRYLPTFTSLAVRNYNGDVVQGNVTMSNGFGVMLGHNLSKYVGIQAEINYDQISQTYKDRGLDQKVSINYINVPILLAINTDKTAPVFLGVVIGPQFGINIGSSFKGNSVSNTDTVRAVLAVKQGDIGMAYGAGLGIALNPQRNVRLDLGFRGVYGLVNMSGTSTSDNSYNILVKGSRKSYGGYLGITFLF